MKAKYLSYIQIGLMIFLLIISSSTLTFSIMKADTISITGPIESVDREYKFIIVNRTKIIIQTGTAIVNENGRPLSKERLIPGESVIVEAIRISKDLFAQKIMIKSGFKRP